MPKHALERWDKWCLLMIFSVAGFPRLRLALRDGPVVGCPPECSRGTIVIRNRSALLRMLMEAEIDFGEGYLDGSIEIEGDLVALLESVYRAQRGRPRPFLGRTVSWLLELLQANSLAGSRSNIHRHYDLGNRFFQSWLDREMVYTCAYFETPDQSLEDAQFAKNELICRKLRLVPGESVVEAGCGWGSLAIHMARRFGVQVRAYNISHAQISYAHQRAKAEGLAHQVKFIEDDYRNITGSAGVFVSIGMLEHVGAGHYGDLGRVVHRTIGDQGRGLLHFIGRNYPAPLSAWTRAHIFPGASVPTLSQVARALEPWDFTLLDVENLRPHYAWTIEHWLRRYESAMPELQKHYDARFLRAWRLHHAGSLTAFRTGTLQLFQVLFAGRDCQGLPATRAGLYQPMRLTGEAANVRA